MSKKEESKIVKEILTWIKKEPKSFFFKIHGSPFQMAGISDLIGLMNGNFYAIEVKKKTDKKGASPLQKYFLLKVKKCGGRSFLARSLKEVQVMIRHLK